jgi:PAS domain S-box-containing protein
MLTTLETARIGELLDKLVLPPEARLSVLDSAGQLIASTRQPRDAADALFADSPLKAKTLHEARWTVRLEIPRSTYLQPVRRVAWMMLAVLLLATLTAWALAAWGRRVLERAVGSLLHPDRTPAGRLQISEFRQVGQQLQALDLGRLNALSALQSTEATFQTIFGGLPDGVVYADLERRVKLVNPAFTRMFGYTSEELAGRSTEFMYADKADYEEQGRRRFNPQASASATSYELRYRRRDGSEFWGESRGLTIIGADGRPVGLLGVHRDITDRKRNEERLRQSRAQLQNFIEQAPQSIAMFDRESRYLAASRSWLLLFGAPPGGLGGQTYEAVHPDHPERWAEARARGLHGETLVEDEDCWRQADGSERWLRWSVSPWADEDGAIGGIIISSKDITENKQHVQALRELHDRFAAVFKTIPMGIGISRLSDGVLVDVNPAFEAMLGFTRAELIGRPITAPEFWADEATRASLIDTMRSTTLVRGLETQLRTKAGTVLDVSYDGCQVQLNGTPFFVGMAFDISLLKQAGRDLRNQKSLLAEQVEARTSELDHAYRELSDSSRFVRTITDSLPGRVSYWDTDLICRFANQTYLDWSQLSADAVLGRRMQDTIPAEYFEVARPFTEQALRGEACTYEYTTARDGRRYVHQIIYVPDRHADGQVHGLFAMAFDITAIKEAEARLRAANTELLQARDLADAATRAKSSFLANMSHEIRTPMNAIMGLTHLMQRSEDSPRQLERLAKIEMAGRHLLSVINDVLDFSKIEANHMRLEHADFHVGEVLENVRSMIADQARAKGLRVEIDAAGVPEHLHGDAARLSQALLNYASNAVKFTSSGGVRLRCRLLGEDADGLHLRFEVHDTGIGIAPDKLPHLFSSFEQADASIARRFGGTGLGLAITRRLAELMGGAAGAASVEGEGSQFWFEVRLQRGGREALAIAADEPAEVEARLRARAGRVRLLVVDDSEINREVALEMLEGVGLRADVAVNGLEAVAAARRQAYDLVLMDMQMPEMDGLSATRAIRALPGWADVPIVAMTANAFKEDREACEAAGMNDVVTKPVDPAKLFAALARWLPAPGRSRPAAPAADAIDLSSLPEIAGLDTAAGLTYCGGKLPLYLKVLRRFRDGPAGAFCADFRAACTDGQPQAASLLAHTLVGMASSLGAGRVSQLAARLDRAATAAGSDERDQLLAELQRELDRLRLALAVLDDAPAG